MSLVQERRLAEMNSDNLGFRSRQIQIQRTGRRRRKIAECGDLVTVMQPRRAWRLNQEAGGASSVVYPASP